MIPASAIMPIMEVAVKLAPSKACPGMTPMIVKGNRRHDDERHRVGAELGDDEQVDEDQTHRVGETHVAEGLVRDRPLAIPFDAEVAQSVREG